MLSFLGIKDNLYYIKDSDDGVIDKVEYKDLLYYITELNLDIKGIIFCKRTGQLLCEVISGGKSKSTRFFKEEVYNMYENEYTVLGEYTKGSNAILLQHNICGYKYTQEPRLFLSGKRCPHCFRLYKQTTEEFKSFIKKVEGDNYTLLSEYDGANNSITVRHNVCGLSYNVTAANFKRGQRCPNCAKTGVPIRSFNEVAYLVNEHSIDYELVSYTNSISNCTLKHLICGTVFDIRLYTFLNHNGGCPLCRHSAPEFLLQEELKKWFKCECNCRPEWLLQPNGYRLELDVYIPELRLAIEYDSYTYHIDRVKNDLYKDYLCNKASVKVIRLREFGLPYLASGSVQIFATNTISLRHNKGIIDFEFMMNELLKHLGVTSVYKFSDSSLIDLI